MMTQQEKLDAITIGSWINQQVEIDTIMCEYPGGFRTGPVYKVVGFDNDGIDTMNMDDNTLYRFERSSNKHLVKLDNRSGEFDTMS